MSAESPELGGLGDVLVVYPTLISIVIATTQFACVGYEPKQDREQRIKNVTTGRSSAWGGGQEASLHKPPSHVDKRRGDACKVVVGACTG